MTTITISSTSERRVARRILRNGGMPTHLVQTMSYAALATALAERGWSAQSFAARCAADAGATTTTGDDDGESGTVPAAIAAAQPATGASIDAAVASMIAAVVASMPKPQADISPEAIRVIVQQVVDERIPREVIVKSATGTYKVDGIVHEAFDDVLAFVNSGWNVWITGPAGSGKSTLLRQVYRALGFTDPVDGEDYRTPGRIHMTGAVETPFQLLGYVSPNGDSRTLYTPFRKFWEFGGAFIMDDVDRSNPKALATFNEALANGYCCFPDATIKIHPTCRLGATANTYGLGGGSDYVGAGRMDKATLDRFASLTVGYDERAERLIAGPDMGDWVDMVQRVRRSVAALGLKHLVTPRATFKGAALLRAGVSRSKVEAAALYSGLDDETVRRIKGGI